MVSYLSSISSYITGTGEPEQDDKDQQLNDENQSSEQKNDQQEELQAKRETLQEETTTDNTANQESYMSSLFKSAANALSGPECQILLSNAQHGCGKLYRNGDDIKGTIVIKTATQPQLVNHDGIKVSLYGEIVNKSNDIYLGSAASQLLGAERQYTFMQMTRELEFQGSFDSQFTSDFCFKNMEMSQDSYNGISLNLNYYVKVEMTYQGNLMKYKMEQAQPFAVINFTEDSQADQETSVQSKDNVKPNVVQQSFKPSVMIDYEAYQTGNSIKRDLLVQLSINNTYLNLDTDAISGWIKLKDISADAHQHTTGIQIELIQQEIQGTTQSQDGNELPYKLRVLKQYQIVDGCPEKDDKIKFKLPLRGLAFKHMSPTLKNVLNKFSVRYYLKVVFEQQRIVETIKNEEQLEAYEDGEASQEEIIIEQEQIDSRIESSLYEVTLWR